MRGQVRIRPRPRRCRCSQITTPLFSCSRPARASSARRSRRADRPTGRPGAAPAAPGGQIRPRLPPRRVAWRTFAEILRVGAGSLAATLNYLTLIVLTGTSPISTARTCRLRARHAPRLPALRSIRGVAAATITLVGMVTGARRFDLVVEYVRKTMFGVAVVVALPCLVVILRPSPGSASHRRCRHPRGRRALLRSVGPSYPFAMTSMVLASAFQGLAGDDPARHERARRAGRRPGDPRTATGAGALPFPLISGGNVVSCAARGDVPPHLGSLGAVARTGRHS
jgi:hypothetical protein